MASVLICYTAISLDKPLAPPATRDVRVGHDLLIRLCARSCLAGEAMLPGSDQHAVPLLHFWHEHACMDPALVALEPMPGKEGTCPVYIQHKVFLSEVQQPLLGCSSCTCCILTGICWVLCIVSIVCTALQYLAYPCAAQQSFCWNCVLVSDRIFVVSVCTYFWQSLHRNSCWGCLLVDLVVWFYNLSDRSPPPPPRPCSFASLPSLSARHAMWCDVMSRHVTPRRLASSGFLVSSLQLREVLHVADRQVRKRHFASDTSRHVVFFLSRYRL